MTAWLHLRKDILLEFYEQAMLGRRDDVSAETLVMAYLERQKATSRDVHNPRNNFKRKVRLVRIKKAKLALRPPCPQCGQRVENPSVQARFCGRNCRSRALREAARAAVTPELRAARKAAQYEKQSASLRARWAEKRASTSARPPDGE